VDLVEVGEDPIADRRRRRRSGLEPDLGEQPLDLAQLLGLALAQLLEPSPRRRQSGRRGLGEQSVAPVTNERP
jgi:hypothetical protein